MLCLWWIIGLGRVFGWTLQKVLPFSTPGSAPFPPRKIEKHSINTQNSLQIKFELHLRIRVTNGTFVILEAHVSPPAGRRPGQATEVQLISNSEETCDAAAPRMHVKEQHGMQNP